MKGTFFQKPLELSILVEGETWQQGEPVSGALTLKNHGDEPVSLMGMHVDLSVGDLKKVRTKNPTAFKPAGSKAWDQGDTLAPGQSATMNWEFSTGLGFQITDSWASPFVVYGVGDAADKLGQLQLSFKAAPAVQDFLDVFKTDFRFVTKTQKSSKGWLEAKLTPPDGSAFSKLDQVITSFKFDEEETLAVHYAIQVKTIQATVAGTETKKVLHEHEQTLRRDQYRLASGRIRHEAFEDAIREALASVG